MTCAWGLWGEGGGAGGRGVPGSVGGRRRAGGSAHGMAWHGRMRRCMAARTQGWFMSIDIAPDHLTTFLPIHLSTCPPHPLNHLTHLQHPPHHLPTSPPTYLPRLVIGQLCRSTQSRAHLLTVRFRTIPCHRVRASTTKHRIGAYCSGTMCPCGDDLVKPTVLFRPSQARAVHSRA